MTTDLSRREWLVGAAAAVGAGLAATPTRADKERPADEPFGYCLNMSTIRGQKLTMVQAVETASRAGYTSIEPWVSEIDKHVKDGGTLKDLDKRIRDLGLTVESAIAFPEWVVDDDERRKKALEEARRAMDVVKQIGGKRIAAPPSGATKQANLDLRKAAERYRALLEIGDQIGVVPQVELWGFSQSLHRLGEVALVAIDSGHPKACILPDVYHLYKGGSDVGGLKLLSGASMHCFHMNDYPAKPPRAEITDAARIYPGDGVAPLKDLLRTLRDIGYRGVLSLELFNQEYWRQDALAVARAGLDKMRAVVRAAMKG